MAGATFATHLDDARVLKDVEVAGSGRPGVGEATREVAGGELGSEVGEREDELTARGMGERGEDGVDVVEAARGRFVAWTRMTST